MNTAHPKRMALNEFRERYEEASIDVQLARMGHIRDIGKLDGVKRFLDEVYESVLGEAAPEYEPEYRVVKAS